MQVVYCIPGLWNAGGMERVLTQKVNWLCAHTDWEITIVTTEIVPAGKQRCAFPLDERVEVVELNIDFNADYHLPLLKKSIHHLRKQHIYQRQFEEWLGVKGEGLRVKGEGLVWISLCGKEIEWMGKVKTPCRKLAEIHFAMDYRAHWLKQKKEGVLWTLIGQIMTKQLVRWMRGVDQLVVLTEADGQAWREQGLTHVQVISNPSSIMPDTCGTHEQKQVLAVGRLEKQKGFDWLIEAWSRIANQFPDWTLRICGEGSERDRLQVTGDRLQVKGERLKVKMEGVSKDLEGEYLRSGLFVLSSRYEGLPLALIEAMSCGCCCIAMDCPEGPRELITDNQNGCLIPLGDIDSLAQKIAQMITNEQQRKQLGKAARAYAQAHFTLDPIMQKWVQLLSQA